MKRTYLILISIYTFAMLYFAIFNWEMFIVNLNISLGFAVVRLPLVIVLFLIGLFILFFAWLFLRIFSLRVERDIANKDNEITKLKAAQFDSQLTEVHNMTMSLKELHNKINTIMEKIETNVKDTQKTQSTN